MDWKLHVLVILIICICFSYEQTGKFHYFCSKTLCLPVSLSFCLLFVLDTSCFLLLWKMKKFQRLDWKPQNPSCNLLFSPLRQSKLVFSLSCDFFCKKHQLLTISHAVFFEIYSTQCLESRVQTKRSFQCPNQETKTHPWTYFFPTTGATSLKKTGTFGTKGATKPKSSSSETWRAAWTNGEGSSFSSSLWLETHWRSLCSSNRTCASTPWTFASSLWRPLICCIHSSGKPGVTPSEAFSGPTRLPRP